MHNSKYTTLPAVSKWDYGVIAVDAKCVTHVEMVAIHA
jgi:hypothetical protein